LQQKPSAQKPDWHWVGSVQSEPTGSLPLHTVAVQVPPATQSEALAQLARQAVPPQT
jgi:hypothetical protein